LNHEAFRIEFRKPCLRRHFRPAELKSEVVYGGELRQE
jgi:hypothetical protein